MREELTAFWDGLKRTLGAAADLILLNFLMILCCVPVVTAGAAWVSSYAHLLRIVRGEATGFPFKPFLEDFRRGFRQATLAWLLLAVVLILLAGDYYYAARVADPVNGFFLAFSIAMAAMVLPSAVWLFPLMARYENRLGAHLKNSFLMAIAALPRTLLALMVQLLFATLPFLLPDLFLYAGWVWVLFGFSLPMYVTARLFRKPLGCAPAAKEPDGQN